MRTIRKLTLNQVSTLGWCSIAFGVLVRLADRHWIEPLFGHHSPLLDTIRYVGVFGLPMLLMLFFLVILVVKYVEHYDQKRTNAPK